MCITQVKKRGENLNLNNKNVSSYKEITYNDIIKAFLCRKLKITERNISTYNIESLYDFRGNAIRNKMWYRGNAYELRKFYGSITNDIGTSFWGTDEGDNKIRRMHVDMPRMIVNSLVNIVVPDLNEISVEDKNLEKIWEEIKKNNEFDKFLKRAVKKTLVVGDGAEKIAFKESISKYPLLEFYSGEDVSFVYDRGKLTEIQFYNYYDIKDKKFTLVEKYGYGYIEYELYIHPHYHMYLIMENSF